MRYEQRLCVCDPKPRITPYSRTNSPQDELKAENARLRARIAKLEKG